MAKIKVLLLAAFLLLYTTNITSAAPFDSSISFDNVQLVSLDDEEDVEEGEETEEEVEEEVEEE